MMIALLSTALFVTAAAMPAKAMSLTSSDVHPGATVPLQQVHGACGGENVSPALSWQGAPTNTKSFAVTVFDPDAPRKGGWWHWIALGLPPTLHHLARDAGKADGSGMPEGAIQGTNDYGEIGYGGPCPPKGDGAHRYRFMLWALDTDKIPFGANVKGPDALTWLMEHAIAKTTMTPVYGR